MPLGGWRPAGSRIGSTPPCRVRTEGSAGQSILFSESPFRKFPAINLLAPGTLMDMLALLLILTPILLPLVKAVGVDRVHFGMIPNLGIGRITPPVGTVLFVGSAVAKLPIGQAVRAPMPFFGRLLIVLGIVTHGPALPLWLPRRVGV